MVNAFAGADARVSSRAFPTKHFRPAAAASGATPRPAMPYNQRLCPPPTNRIATDPKAPRVKAIRVKAPRPARPSPAAAFSGARPPWPLPPLSA